MGHRLRDARLQGRREALRRLAALLAAATLGGCQKSCTWPVSSGAITAALVDIHCHVFNVRDMPAYAFIMDVALNIPLVKDFASPLAKLVVEIARAAAPTDAEELAALALIRINPSAAATLMHSPGFPVALFIAGLQGFITKYQPFPPTPPPTPTLDAVFIQKLLDTFIPGVVDLSKPQAVILQSIVDNAPALALAIQNALAGGTGLDLKTYLAQFLMYWAPHLAYYRFQLVEELAELSGGSSPPPNLLTPATLDITAWLPDSIIDFAPTPLSQQAELMRQIALLQPATRAMHGFIGFDPWRQIDDVAKGRPVTALDVVKNAVEHQGFAGVKLYPPMGFRATDNASLGDSSFPLWLATPYPGLGARLDAALDTLYAYCAANDVPIMAHCAASQGAATDYELRADPVFWAMVLDKPVYKNLRLNLGHFGGVWNFDGVAPTLSDPHIAWTKAIADMIQSGKYPNLYTDLGDFAGLLDRTPGEAATTQTILANVKALVAADPLLRSRLMYGTDWLLLGREPQSSAYFAKLSTQLKTTLSVPDVSDLVWRNASKFLGLGAGQPTRVRLSKFYTDNGANPALLNAFA